MKQSVSEVYPEPSETSKMKLFVKAIKTEIRQLFL